MKLRLKLPDGLRAVKPYLDCRRDPAFPHYAMDEATRDAIMPPNTLTSRDQEIREHENARLGFDPLQRTWEMTITDPIVGYNYQLRWRLPPDTIDPTIRAEVVAAQRQLLAAGDRDQHPTAWGTFDEHRLLIEGFLRDNRDPNEKRGLEVFIYDRSRLDLVPVFSYRSWLPGPLPQNFRIGLGDGIAGVAFQQRRIVPWSGLTQDDPFIQPVPYPNVPGEDPMKLTTMIAFPIYHSKFAKGRPPSWSVIGTVCFSSSSEASMIAGMCTTERTTDIEQLMFTAERYSQDMVQDILETLAAP
ncbi:MAG TPA: hypothetical protein VHX39_00915 [Acetobacteraceae bacterium]|nr:hypothetical protein [Acetobacteraceae bacterium]